MFGDKYSLTGLKNRFNNKFNRKKCYLIDMELRNGMNSLFMVTTKEEYFTYDDGLYILPKSPEMSSYNIQSKLNRIRYHQDFPIPLSILLKIEKDNLKGLKQLNIKDIVKDFKETGFNSLELIKAIESTGITTLETAFNPKSLQLFVKSTVIQNVLRGQQMAEWFTRAMVLLWIITAGVIIHLVIYLQQSGALSNVL